MARNISMQLSLLEVAGRRVYDPDNIQGQSGKDNKDKVNGEEKSAL